jgi:hypothetical protein
MFAMIPATAAWAAMEAPALPDESSMISETPHFLQFADHHGAAAILIRAGRAEVIELQGDGLALQPDFDHGSGTFAERNGIGEIGKPEPIVVPPKARAGVLATRPARKPADPATRDNRRIRSASVLQL